MDTLTTTQLIAPKLADSTAAPTTAPKTGSLAWAGVTAAAVASVATAAVAAGGHAAGVSLNVGGAPIPVQGFAMLTAIFSLIGLAIAAVLSRRAAHPRAAFVRTTVVLLALSLVPDAVAQAGLPTKALLMSTHLLAVHTVEGDPTPSDEEMQTMFAQVGEVNAELQAAGKWVFAGGLLPAESATVVRTEGGTTTMTDGPFAETKERIAGFWVLKLADLDEALAWAAKCSAACGGPVEVRPFDDLTNG